MQEKLPVIERKKSILSVSIDIKCAYLASKTSIFWPSIDISILIASIASIVYLVSIYPPTYETSVLR